MKPELKDLDALFKRFIAAKAAQEEDPMALEDQVAELYEEWLQTPIEQLGGPPQTYFDDAAKDELAALLCDYINARITPPDLLLDRIVDVAPARELHELLAAAQERATDAGAANELRIAVVELLNQLGYAGALPDYIELLLTQSDGTLLQAVSQAVAAMGESALAALKAAARTAPAHALPVLLDLISARDTGDDVYEAVEAAFAASPAELYIYAPLMARFSSQRAVAALTAAMDSGVGYLDYLALRDALESLGEVVGERDFTGDPDYEKMKVY